MVKKLTKHGNSLALVIDKAVLELLKIDADTPLDITTDGDVLIITPIRGKKRKKKYEQEIFQDAQTVGGVSIGYKLPRA